MKRWAGLASPALALLVLALLTPAVAAGLRAHASVARAESSGGFSVLTYNIAGLPEPLSSAPTPRQPSTTAIGARLAPYDLVNVQEDFNYHADLYAADSHPHRTPTSGGAGIGSGLNMLSDSPYRDFARVRWTSCQLDSGDCLTPKGFTFTRVRLAEGVYVGVYNLHTNAGTSAGDEESRAANLDQLSAYIRTHSAGDAVIVMGDTNARYTRAKDTIARFAADNELSDAWVQLERGGEAPAAGSDPLLCDENAVTDACEVVDKVLYRGSRLVSLTATDYRNEHHTFLDPSGAMLSDHYPVSVRFTWSRGAAFAASDLVGGPHGDPFNDIDALATGTAVTMLTLRSGHGSTG